MTSKLGAVLLVAAVALGGDGLWLHAKAVLAQELLAHAWSAAESGDARPRPWPWADTWPVARLEVPRLGIEQIVLAGASGRVLAFAPGHVDGTPLPGEPGNAILAGHRDTTFRFLERLQPGDRIRTRLPDGRETLFTVDSTRVQDAADPWAFDAPDGATTLTLATCWPFDSPVPGGRLRYVVRAVASAPRARSAS